MISKITDMDSVKDLFAGWEETCIWSCLQGVMGGIYADKDEYGTKPRSAMAVLGDFCFFAGEANADLVKYRPACCDMGATHAPRHCDTGETHAPQHCDTGEIHTSRHCDTGETHISQLLDAGAEAASSEFAAEHSNMVIMVPQNPQWAELIERIYQNGARKMQRYAIKKEADVFDRAYLKKIVDNIMEEGHSMEERHSNKVTHHNEAWYPSEPSSHNEALQHNADYVLRSIDQALYQQCREQPWSRDLVSQFPSYEMYSRYGLGFVILKNGEIVSGASSYSAYLQGIEIQIDTRKDHRRKGLALICGARLILECLDRGLYPSWDAYNKASVALAEKLGYHYSHAYDAYEVGGVSFSLSSAPEVASTIK